MSVFVEIEQDRVNWFTEKQTFSKPSAELPREGKVVREWKCAQETMDPISMQYLKWRPTDTIKFCNSALLILQSFFTLSGNK